MGITAKTHTYWNPKVTVEQPTKIAGERLSQAAELLADKTRTNLRTIIQHQVSRPVYGDRRYRGKVSKDAGKWWTARDAGELLKSVRVVKKEDNPLNVWVMVGQSKAYYSAMFEFASSVKRGKAFFRPAIASCRRKMINIIEKGE